VRKLWVADGDYDVVVLDHGEALALTGGEAALLS